MSKAFTKEDDDLPEPPLARPAASPPGGRNYLTPDGAQRLREELDRLLAGGTADQSSRRIQRLRQVLRTAVVMPPPSGSEEQVRFGALVTVRHANGEETQYRLVGADETDLDRNWISWRSPVAAALLKARKGERVRLRLPGGEESLEIVDIAYGRAASAGSPHS